MRSLGPNDGPEPDRSKPDVQSVGLSPTLSNVKADLVSGFESRTG